jgi:hypothetical protein
MRIELMPVTGKKWGNSTPVNDCLPSALVVTAGESFLLTGVWYLPLQRLTDADVLVVGAGYKIDGYNVGTQHGRKIMF